MLDAADAAPNSGPQPPPSKSGTGSGKLPPARDRLRQLKQVGWRLRAAVRSRQALWSTRLLWRTRAGKGRPHGLPHPLVVSLTSYPPRFGTLAPTLQCLLSQAVAPDHVILWLAAGDVGLLPPDVLALRKHGLEIRPTEDLRSYKKIIPALREFPNCFIVTADDDVYYTHSWLKQLVSQYSGRTDEIVCCRAHGIRLDAGGRPLPYISWEMEKPGPATSPLLLPTGCGGVLYPPTSLPAAVDDPAAFLKLCPAGDDLWLYWWAAGAGRTFTKTAGVFDLINWPGSQEVSLFHENVVHSNGNDRQIAALLARYGFPTRNGSDGLAGSVTAYRTTLEAAQS